MANAKIVKQWFTYAIRDLKAAKAIREMGPEYKSIVAFNCQQCVEKSIKGFLVFHGLRPPKTHTIKDLAHAIAQIDGSLAKKLHKADKLTKFAVAYRYPDAEKKPLTLKETDSALKLAQAIFDDLLARVDK